MSEPNTIDAELIRLIEMKDITIHGGGLRLSGQPGLPAPGPEPDSDDTARTGSELDEIACIILAAGRSERFGEANKLLAEIDGKPMFVHPVEAALAARLGPVIVVTGHEAERVQAALGRRNVDCIVNTNFAAGMATSLACGIGRAQVAGVGGAMVLLGDMPWVEAMTLETLAAAFRQAGGTKICVPVAAGRFGNPVLFPAFLFPEIINLEGDRGARALLDQHADLVVEINMDNTENTGGGMGGDMGGVIDDIDAPAQLPDGRQTDL